MTCGIARNQHYDNAPCDVSG